MRKHLAARRENARQFCRVNKLGDEFDLVERTSEPSQFAEDVEKDDCGDDGYATNPFCAVR
jgi:hypothetical protein